MADLLFSSDQPSHQTPFQPNIPAHPPNPPPPSLPYLAAAVQGHVNARRRVQLHLGLDPPVGHLEAGADRNAGRPPELLPDHGVVRVAAPDPHGA